MKITIVGTLGGSGPARVVATWARILFRLGHSVELIVDSIGPMGEALAASGNFTITQTPLPEATPGFARRFVHGRLAANILAARSKAEQSDLIFTHFRGETLAVLQKDLGIPHGASFHSPSLDEERLNLWKYGNLVKRTAFLALAGAYWRADAKSIRDVDTIQSESAFTWKLLSERYPLLCREKIWCRVPGGYDESRFFPRDDRDAIRLSLNLPLDRCVFVSVRRLVPRNAPHRIVEAADFVLSKGIKATFYIAGRGPLSESLAAEIKKRGLEKHVHLLGFVSDEDLPKYYSAADATLMPTAELECFGLPAVESLACGTPCLSTPCGALPEILGHFPGFVSQKNNSTSFSKTVEQFANGEIAVHRDSLATYARETYSENALEPYMEAFVEKTVRNFQR